MWITKDERTLLRAVYERIGASGDEFWPSEFDLAEVLNKQKSIVDIPSSFEIQEKPPPKRDEQPTQTRALSVFEMRARVALALNRLGERGLISLRPGSNDYCRGISLLLPGLEMGSKLSKWTGRSQLWFEEYRNHWLWLAAASAGGALMTWLLDILRSR